MLRVGNLQRSIDFYTQVLGMSLIRTSENPEYKYSLAFLGFEGGNPVQAEIELTYNWGTEQYDLGTAYGHIALGVPDAYAACAKIKAAGGNVTREAGPVKGGSRSRRSPRSGRGTRSRALCRQTPMACFFLNAGFLPRAGLHASSRPDRPLAPVSTKTRPHTPRCLDSENRARFAG